MIDGATSGRRACAGLAALLVGCIPGVLSLGPDGSAGPDGTTVGPDGATGDDGSSGAHDGANGGSDTSTSGDGGNLHPDSGGTDGGAGMDAAPDAFDAGPQLEAGYALCVGTAMACDVEGGQECCDTVYGTYAADGGLAYGTGQATCGPVGGPNCGPSFGSVGSSFFDDFPQTCGTSADCPSGDVCCIEVPVGDAASGGELPSGIACVAQASCPAVGKTICTSNADCVTLMTCLPETDPFLSHLVAKDCQ